MNDITLESYLIRDDSSICDEISQIATESFNLSTVSSAGQEIIDKFRSAADALVRNKNPKTQKAYLESMRASVNQLTLDSSKKKISGPETATIIAAILGITATVAAGFGFAKLAGKIKNALKKNDPDSLEKEINTEINSNGIATEGLKNWREGYDSFPAAVYGESSSGFIETFLNWYDHPNVACVSYLVFFIVLPLIAAWKFVKLHFISVI